MPVRLVVEDGPYVGVSGADLARRARAMLDAVQMASSELSILITGNDRIRRLNRLYRKTNRPTDVLSFSQREGELGDPAGRLLGDVVLSVPTARKQAEARGGDLTSELTILLAHGLLHLLGWDHDTPARHRRMRRETERLCEAANNAARAWRARRAARRPIDARTRSMAGGQSLARGPSRTVR